MRRIFRDDKLEEDITVTGFAVVKNAVDAHTCEELSDFFYRFEDVDKRKFTISNWSTNQEYRKLSYQFIAEKLERLAADYLVDYKPVMGVYAAKRPDNNSDMLLHQDWSLVDENVYRSVSIWLALCDMDNVNGNLQVAAKSHLYAGFPRGMNVPVPFEELKDEMQQRYITDIPLAAGDAIIFDHRLIHGSPANKGTYIRLAAVEALIPQEAQMVHYYYHPEKTAELEILKMNASEFYLLDFFDVPNKPKHLDIIDTIPYQFQKVKLPAL